MNTATLQRTALTITDRELPQLGCLVDASFMARLFGNRLFGQPVLSCRILQARYKPFRNCLVSYLVTPESPAKPTIVTIRMYGAESSSAQVAKALATPWIASLDGPAHTFHWPELGIVGYRFPADRKLRNLSHLAAHDRLAAQLTPIIREVYGPNAASGKIESQLIHYVAEHTCTVRVDVRPHGAALPFALFGKLYYNDTGQYTWSRMLHLHRSIDRAEDVLAIARPVDYDAENRLLWQEEVQGAAIDASTMSQPDFLEAIASAGRAVARFHGLPVEDGRSVRPCSERVHEAIDTIAGIRPDLERRFRNLAALLDARSLDLPSNVAWIHGDLHLKNFIRTTNAIALIDLDNVRLGDPLAEVGSFAAGLLYRGLRGGLNAARTEAAIRTFEETYLSRSALSINPSAFRWHTAAALISERSLRAVTRLRIAGCPNLLEQLVAEAEVQAEALR